MRIGITGHQRLRKPSDWGWVKQEFGNLLSTFSPPLIGITSLAVGADQLFAKAVLQRGGALEVIIPFAGYEANFSEGRDQQDFLFLLQSALKREELEKHGSHEDAYLAAGKRVVDQSDLLVALWDGKPAAGLGGTADIVHYAMQKQTRTIHLNPITKQITFLASPCQLDPPGSCVTKNILRRGSS
jgi:hypothetical protein